MVSTILNVYCACVTIKNIQNQIKCIRNSQNHIHKIQKNDKYLFLIQQDLFIAPHNKSYPNVSLLAVTVPMSEHAQTVLLT